MVVDLDSAKFPGYNELYSIHADHMDMTKIPDSPSNDYDRIKGVIARCMREAGNSKCNKSNSRS